MIKVYDFLWLRLQDYGKKYQSGLDSVVEFNSKLDEVQQEIYNELSPFYQANEKIRGLFQQSWIRRSSVTATGGTYTVTPATGEIFDRIISMGITDDSGAIQFEADEISENEIVIVNRAPQRRPNLANKIVYFYTDSGNSLFLLPASTTKILFFYLIFPTTAKIAFTYSQSANEDIMVYDSTNSVDLAWPGNAANIILYKMLEKYGIVNREAWLSQYAQLGISEQMLQGGKVA